MGKPISKLFFVPIGKSEQMNKTIFDGIVIGIPKSVYPVFECSSGCSFARAKAATCDTSTLHIFPRDGVYTHVRFEWVCVEQVNCNKFHTIEWFLSAFEINVINEVAYFMGAIPDPKARDQPQAQPQPGPGGPYKMKRF